jgi:uncharacterized protein (DUF3084 family)
MSEDIAEALHRIAALLQERINQTATMAARAEERMAHLEIPKPQLPDFAEMEAKHDAEALERRELAATQRAEDLAFRERLLSALERQNVLLSHVVERLTAG